MRVSCYMHVYNEFLGMHSICVCIYHLCFPVCLLCMLATHLHSVERDRPKGQSVSWQAPLRLYYYAYCMRVYYYAYCARLCYYAYCMRLCYYAYCMRLYYYAYCMRLYLYTYCNGRVSGGPIHSHVGLMHICWYRLSNLQIMLWQTARNRLGSMPNNTMGATEG